MANINFQTEQPNNYRDSSQSVSLLPNGTSIVMNIPEGCRVFFEQGRPTLFPKNVSGSYAGSGSVLFNFVNGVITGKDESSDNFVPVVPPTGQFQAMTFAVNSESELVSFFGSSGTIAQVRNGVLGGSLTYVGSQPIQTTKLFTVILSSSDGTTLNTIEQPLIFSYLNSLSSNPPSSNVSYTGSEIVIRESILYDLFSGDSSYQTPRTSLKAGDTAIIERTLGLALEEYPVTITGVVSGANYDTVSFTPSLTAQHILELKPSVRATNPTVYSLDRALFQRHRRTVYDSGWVQVVLGSNGIFQTGLPDPLGCTPLVVWNSTKDSSEVTVLLNSFRSDSSRVGVQIYPDGGGQGTVAYHIGATGVFYNLETSALVSSGFIRVFLREN